MLTVPQHKWLYSEADQYAQHHRRYMYIEIKMKLAKAGFEIEYSTSFVTLLLPLMICRRLLGGRKPYKPDDELEISPLLKMLLYMIMLIEAFMLRIGFRFPAGGSLLVLARKKK